MSFLLHVLRFSVLLFVKALRYICYPIDIEWVGNKPRKWQKVRLIVILNHTSLLEFLYGSALPLSYLWRMAGKMTYPVAKETLAVTKPEGFDFT